MTIFLAQNWKLPPLGLPYYNCIFFTSRMFSIDMKYFASFSGNLGTKFKQILEENGSKWYFHAKPIVEVPLAEWGSATV